MIAINIVCVRVYVCVDIAMGLYFLPLPLCCRITGEKSITDSIV